MKAIIGTAGSWLLFWAIYMLIRYASWLTNQGNTRYVKSLWYQHPELKEKLYWANETLAYYKKVPSKYMVPFMMHYLTPIDANDYFLGFAYLDEEFCNRDKGEDNDN